MCIIRLAFKNDESQVERKKKDAPSGLCMTRLETRMYNLR